jgi:hypothetical protein
MRIRPYSRNPTKQTQHSGFVLYSGGREFKSSDDHTALITRRNPISKNRFFFYCIFAIFIIFPSKWDYLKYFSIPKVLSNLVLNLVLSLKTHTKKHISFYKTSFFSVWWKRDRVFSCDQGSIFFIFLFWQSNKYGFKV